MGNPITTRAAVVVAIVVAILAAVGIIYGLTQSKQPARNPSAGLSATAGAVNNGAAAKKKRMEALFNLAPELGWNVKANMPLPALQRKAVIFGSQILTSKHNEGPTSKYDGRFYSWMTIYEAQEWKLVLSGTAPYKDAGTLRTFMVTVSSRSQENGLPGKSAVSELALNDSLVIGRTTIDEVRRLYPEPSQNDGDPQGRSEYLRFCLPGESKDPFIMLWFNNDRVLRKVDFCASIPY